MTITPIGPNSAASTANAASAAQTATRAGNEQVAVKFSPATDNAGPLDRVGSGVVSKLKDLEASRAMRSEAMIGTQAGPANPIDVAKSELLAGPASHSLVSTSGMSTAATPESNLAISAMTRTFDYAIETQLIVKTGSQISTSASSLMRGQ